METEVRDETCLEEVGARPGTDPELAGGGL